MIIGINIGFYLLLRIFIELTFIFNYKDSLNVINEFSIILSVNQDTNEILHVLPIEHYDYSILNGVIVRETNIS